MFNINAYSSFRNEAVTLSADITTMIGKMDAVMAEDVCANLKRASLTDLLNTYMPD